jgi:hypothetical protein
VNELHHKRDDHLPKTKVIGNPEQDKRRAVMIVGGTLLGIIGIATQVPNVLRDVKDSVVNHTGETMIATGAIASAAFALRWLYSNVNDIPKRFKRRSLAAGVALIFAGLVVKPGNEHDTQTVSGATAPSTASASTAQTYPCELVLPLARNDSAGLEKIQAALNEQGFNAGSVDGVQGPKTDAALDSFKQVNGFSTSVLFNGDMCPFLPTLVDGDLTTPAIP